MAASINELMADLAPRTKELIEKKQQEAMEIRGEHGYGIFYDPGIINILAYIGKKVGDQTSLEYLHAISNCPYGLSRKVYSIGFVNVVVSRVGDATPLLKRISLYGTGEMENCYEAREKERKKLEEEVDTIIG